MYEQFFSRVIWLDITDKMEDLLNCGFSFDYVCLSSLDRALRLAGYKKPLYQINGIKYVQYDDHFEVFIPESELCE